MRVAVADGYGVGGGLSQRKAQGVGIGVGYQRTLAGVQTEAGVPEPSDVHESTSTLSGGELVEVTPQVSEFRACD